MIVQYENELDEKKNELKDDYNDDIEKAIETLIEQHCSQPLRMKLNGGIVLLEYNYNTQILEREYLQHKPTEYQVK